MFLRLRHRNICKFSTSFTQLATSGSYTASEHESLIKLYKNHSVYHKKGGQGARGSIVGWGTMLQAGSSRVRFRMRSLVFLIDLFLLAALWPWNRRSLKQKWVPEIFLGLKGGRCVRLTTLPTSVSRLSRENVGTSTSHNPMGLRDLLQG
jgi:hypothetical protein